MAAFASMIPVLDEGGRIRRDVWDATTTMFVRDGELVQQATKEPRPYDLSWYEISAGDWQVVGRTSKPRHTQP